MDPKQSGYLESHLGSLGDDHTRHYVAATDSPVGYFAQYKRDTSVFTTWLGHAAQACGYEPKPTPVAEAVPPQRLKGKARKAAQKAAKQDDECGRQKGKYTVTTEELLVQAEDGYQNEARKKSARDLVYPTLSLRTTQVDTKLNRYTVMLRLLLVTVALRRAASAAVSGCCSTMTSGDDQPGITGWSPDPTTVLVTHLPTMVMGTPLLEQQAWKDVREDTW
ncbi:hypothetical protein F5Y05DRAFT_416251 [Hypoxylon sp. FL0543]|nr:hypothetical protein F5Y05DRAFT_416251 [Hypoxylon sp. FL0543]